MFFYDIPTLTEDGKDLAKSAALLMVKLAEISRKEGILALDDEISEIELANEKCTSLAKSLLSLVVDGNDGDVIAEIARYRIATTAADDNTKVTMMIIANGTLSIQRGENPRIIGTKLSSMCGDFYNEFMNELCRD